MKLYEFIKDLKEDGVDFPYLITLETLIEELESYVQESNDKARVWDITVRYKDALKEPLTFSMFDKEKATAIFFKEFEPCSMLGGYVGGSANNKDVRVFPIKKQETGIIIFDEEGERYNCRTFEDLARATKNNPFELEIK